jgi:hypothetical protein
MNKKLLSFLFLALAAIAFQACKDDDDKPSNNFAFDGTTYSVKTALILLDPTPSGGDFPIYYHELTLLSDGLTYQEGGDVTGKGHGISLSLLSSGADLAAGTYTLNSSSDESTYRAFDVTSGSVILNFDSETEDSDRYEDLLSGTVTVEKSGTNYTITIAAVSADNGQVITASFKGDATVVVDED